MTRRADAERSDKLRRRPDQVRYFYMAVSPTKLHAGMSYRGLEYVVKNHGVTELYLADLVTGRVVKVKDDVKTFMDKWSANYNDVNWEYTASLGKEV